MTHCGVDLPDAGSEGVSSYIEYCMRTKDEASPIGHGGDGGACSGWQPGVPLALHGQNHPVVRLWAQLADV